MDASKGPKFGFDANFQAILVESDLYRFFSFAFYT